LMSEEFSAVLVNKFYKLLNYGLLLRTIEKAMADMERQGEDDPEKRRVLEEANKKALGFFDALASRLEKDIHYQAIPLKKLISIQLNSGFLTMEYLKEKAR
ncbi:MAG: zinc carboxypeptidase, partial [Firmicutes bacterium]|nr:zinc carboxypeptidase [Bacillota bacterium]